MAAWPCVNTLPNGAPCEAKRSAGIHSLHSPDYHPYWKNKPVGLQPMGEGVREYRAASGYDRSKAEMRASGAPCQICSPVCSGWAEDWHEPLPRGRAGGLAAAVEIGGKVPACRPCNGYVMENQVWAREHGWLFSNTLEGRTAASEAKQKREATPKPQPSIPAGTETPAPADLRRPAKRGRSAFED